MDAKRSVVAARQHQLDRGGVLARASGSQAAPAVSARLLREEGRGFEGFEGEEEFFEPNVEITEDGPRPRRRHESEWQKRLATYGPPAHRFQCCGTWYGAMTAQALALTRRVHCEIRHKVEPRG